MGCLTHVRRPLQRLSGLLTAVLALAILGGLLTPQPASANELFPADSEQLYFEQTGQVLGGVFLEAWNNLGGTDRTGFPISPAVQIGDKWVQWFEFARLDIPAAELTADKVTVAPAGRLYADPVNRHARDRARGTGRGGIAACGLRCSIAGGGGGGGANRATAPTGAA